MKDCKICHMYYNGECISDHCIQEYNPTDYHNIRTGQDSIPYDVKEIDGRLYITEADNEMQE